MEEEINIQTPGGGKPFHEQIDEVRKILEENLRYTKVIHDFTPKDAEQKEKEMLKLMNDNFEYTRACYALLEKVNRWIFRQKIYSILKILIFVIPLILAILYLPPLIQNAASPYMELLNDAKIFPTK